jgi:hypothetical protein
MLQWCWVQALGFVFSPLQAPLHCVFCTFKCQLFCLDLSPLFFLLLFPCQVFFLHLFIYLSFQCSIKMAESIHCELEKHALWALLKKCGTKWKTTWDPRSTWILSLSLASKQTFGVWTRRRKCVYYEGTLNPFWTPLFKNHSHLWERGTWSREGEGGCRHGFFKSFLRTSLIRPFCF